MTEILGALVGSLAVIGIPIVAWSSRRFTREGRLLLRIERLGSAHALMPNSSEKELFETHVNQVTAELNEWLDEGNRRRRRIQRRVSTSIYVLGMLAVFLSVPFTTSDDPWRSTTIGVGVGIFIVVATFGSSFLLSRNSRINVEKEARQKEKAEEALRLEALRLGKMNAAD